MGGIEVPEKPGHWLGNNGVRQVIVDHQEQTIGPVLKANDDAGRLLGGLEELPGRRNDGSRLPVIGRDGEQIPQFQERHDFLEIEGD
jgi:hypothetical protein